MTDGKRRFRPRPYRRSGFHALVAASRQAGLSALDGRSTQARAIKLWKSQVGRDLGGDLSAQQLTLLDVAAVDMALLAVADSWLKENAGRLVNKKRKTFVPLVAERLRVATHLADVLKLLGLERKAREVPDLGEYMRTHGAAARDAQEQADEAQADPEAQDAPTGDVGDGGEE